MYFSSGRCFWVLLQKIERHEEEKAMRLKEGKNGRTYVVERISIELNLERRLEALGLTEGSKITVLNNDKKGAMTVKFRERGLHSGGGSPTTSM